MNSKRKVSAERCNIYAKKALNREKVSTQISIDIMIHANQLSASDRSKYHKLIIAAVALTNKKVSFAGGCAFSTI